MLQEIKGTISYYIPNSDYSEATVKAIDSYLKNPDERHTGQLVTILTQLLGYVEYELIPYYKKSHMVGAYETYVNLKEMDKNGKLVLKILKE